jgi:hypothetical protein
VRVVELELRRRLPHLRVDLFAPDAQTLPTRALRPPAALCRPSRGRPDSFAELYDLILIAGEPAPRDVEDLRRLLEGLAGRCPVAFHCVSVRDTTLQDRLTALDPEIPEFPEPAFLAPRLVADDVLAKRLGYLRIMGWYPPSSAPILIEKAQAASEVESGRPVVLLEPTGESGLPAGIEVYRLDGDAAVDDWIAAIAHARCLASGSASVTATALAFGVPASDDRELGPADEAAARLDDHFDGLAELTEGSWATRGEARRGPSVTTLARALADAELRADLLLRAYEARGNRLVAERLRFAELIDALDADIEKAELAVHNEELRSQIARMDAAEAAARLGIDELEAELAKLRAEVQQLRERDA